MANAINTRTGLPIVAYESASGCIFDIKQGSAEESFALWSGKRDGINAVTKRRDLNTWRRDNLPLTGNVLIDAAGNRCRMKDTKVG